MKKQLSSLTLSITLLTVLPSTQLHSAAQPPAIHTTHASQADSATNKLFDAANQGDTSLALEAIHEHAHINAQNSYGRTPLIRAVASGHADIVNVLLEHKADIMIQDNNGDTALSWAAYKQHSYAIGLLLDHAISIDKIPKNYVNIQNKSGDTALIEAMRKVYLVSEKECRSIIELLINHDADFNIENNKGDTALSLAEPWQAKALYTKILNKIDQQDWELATLLSSGVVEQFLIPTLAAIVYAYADPYYTSEEPLYGFMQEHILNNITQSQILNPPSASPVLSPAGVSKVTRVSPMAYLKLR